MEVWRRITMPPPPEPQGGGGMEARAGAGAEAARYGHMERGMKGMECTLQATVSGHERYGMHFAVHRFVLGA